MKKIFIALSALCLFSLFSCTKADNLSGPDAAFQGNVIDSVTGKNLLTGSQDFNIALYDISWRQNPDVYNIPIKQDGTFENTGVFSGHFQILPNQGPFWPADTTEMDIKGKTTKDFIVVPYLEITNFTHRLSGDTLIMTCQLNPPRTEGLPEIIDIQPFINTTAFVSSGATLSSQYTVPNTLAINSNWDGSMASKVFEIRVPGLLGGRTFYARLGVRVNDSYKKFNYTDVIEVDVP